MPLQPQPKFSFGLAASSVPLSARRTASTTHSNRPPSSLQLDAAVAALSTRRPPSADSTSSGRSKPNAAVSLAVALEARARSLLEKQLDEKIALVDHGDDALRSHIRFQSNRGIIEEKELQLTYIAPQQPQDYANPMHITGFLDPYSKEVAQVLSEQENHEEGRAFRKAMLDTYRVLRKTKSWTQKDRDSAESQIINRTRMMGRAASSTTTVNNVPQRSPVKIRPSNENQSPSRLPGISGKDGSSPSKDVPIVFAKPRRGPPVPLLNMQKVRSSSSLPYSRRTDTALSSMRAPSSAASLAPTVPLQPHPPSSRRSVASGRAGLLGSQRPPSGPSGDVLLMGPLISSRRVDTDTFQRSKVDMLRQLDT